MSTRTFPPLWRDYWQTVANENYLIAGELIELSTSVTAHFASFIKARDLPGGGRDTDLDWQAAAAAADRWACSSTEGRLLDLVLSLVQPDDKERLIDARDLGRMGSWSPDVARILHGFILGR